MKQSRTEAGHVVPQESTGERWGGWPSATTAELMMPDRTRAQVQITEKKLTSLKAPSGCKPRLGVQFVHSRIGAGQEERQLGAASHCTQHHALAKKDLKSTAVSS